MAIRRLTGDPIRTSPGWETGPEKRGTDVVFSGPEAQPGGGAGGPQSAWWGLGCDASPGGLPGGLAVSLSGRPTVLGLAVRLSPSEEDRPAAPPAPGSLGARQRFRTHAGVPSCCGSSARIGLLASIFSQNNTPTP